jgi:hypothetical protein
MKKKPQVMAYVAKLDTNGIYQGVEEIPEKEVTEAHVRVPKDCDLVPGKYKWIASPGTFMPVLLIDQDKKKARVS